MGAFSRNSLSCMNGGGGTRTHIRLRAPVFKTGSLAIRTPLQAPSKMKETDCRINWGAKQKWSRGPPTFRSSQGSRPGPGSGALLRRLYGDRLNAAQPRKNLSRNRSRK